MFRPISVSLNFTTAATPGAAWTAFTGVARWPEVLPDISEARIEPGGMLTPGASIRTIAKPDRNIIDMSYRVIAVERERLLSIQSSAEGFRADTTYMFAPLDDADLARGTQLAVTATVTPERLRGRVVSILWRRNLAEQVERAVRRRTGALIELIDRAGSPR